MAHKKEVESEATREVRRETRKWLEEHLGIFVIYKVKYSKKKQKHIQRGEFIIFHD